MATFEYGPIELYLIGLDGDRPSPGLIDALSELLEGGLLRLLDFIIVSKSEDGEVTVTEIEDETDEYGFGGVEISITGITGDEDIQDLAELVPPGSSAAIVALELLWARRLAGSLAASGGVVLSVERIPAPVVNAVFDSLATEN